LITLVGESLGKFWFAENKNLMLSLPNFVLLLAFSVSPKEIRIISKTQWKEQGGTTYRHCEKARVETISHYKGGKGSLISLETAKRTLNVPKQCHKAEKEKTEEGKVFRRKSTVTTHQRSEMFPENDNATCIFCNHLLYDTKSEPGWIR